MKVDKYLKRSQQRATKGEIVFNSLMPNRSFWGTWGWNNRLEQVQHLTNFVYVCCDTVCSLLGQHLPNMAYVEDSDDETETAGAGRSQRRKNHLDRRGNYVYEFRHQLVDSYDAGKLHGLNGAASKGWDGAALIGAHRHATEQYPGYRTYKAITNAQPHENLDPLSSQHPLRRLFVNPNPYDTSYDLIYELVLFELLCGVSYLWAVPNSFGEPCELWVIPAHWVWPRGSGGQTVDPAYQHLVSWYEVRPFGAAGGGYGMVRIPAEEVIAFTMKSPLSKVDGWSKLTACSQWIDTSESMDRSAWAQMQNQGMPSMFIELGEAYADADDNQTARIEAKFAQKLGGEYNVGRPFVGKPGMKMTPLNWSPESMMYPQMGEAYRDKVLGAFHLSKVAVGMMDDMTYGSILAALAHTWIHCLNPLAGAVGQRLTKELAPQFASPSYRKWLKEGGQWLDTSNEVIPSLFLSGGHKSSYPGPTRQFYEKPPTKSGYVRDPSGKRRISTDREEEQEREIRVWWPDGSPPDPQQVNADLQADFSMAAVTTNEVRAIRGRPPYELGGDNPLVQGPGGLMPLPLNVEEDMEGLGELVGEFSAAASGGGEEEQGDGQGQPGEGVAGGDGAVPGGNGVPGVVSGESADGSDGEPTLEEMSEEPEGMNPAQEEPNSKPSKGIRWVRRKAACTPGHTQARDECTPAGDGGGSKKPAEPPQTVGLNGLKELKVGSVVTIDNGRYSVEPFDGDDTFPPAIAGYEIKGGVILYHGRNGSEGVVSGSKEEAVKWMRDVDKEVKSHPPEDSEMRPWTPEDGGAELIKKAQDAGNKAAQEFGIKVPRLDFAFRPADYGIGGEAGHEGVSVVNAHKNKPAAFNFKAPGVTQGMHFAAHEVLHKAYEQNPELGKAMAKEAVAAGPVSIYGSVAGGLECLMELGAAYVTAPEALEKFNPKAYAVAEQWATLSRKASHGKGLQPGDWRRAILHLQAGRGSQVGTRSQHRGQEYLGLRKEVSGQARAKGSNLRGLDNAGPVAAGLALVAEDTGRVLLLQRQLDEEDHNSGKWEFPSGRREVE